MAEPCLISQRSELGVDVIVRPGAYLSLGVLPHTGALDRPHSSSSRCTGGVPVRVVLGRANEFEFVEVRATTFFPRRFVVEVAAVVARIATVGNAAAVANDGGESLER